MKLKKGYIPPDVGEEEIESEQNEAAIEEDMPSSKMNGAAKMNAALEKITAQITALNEARETNTERLLRVSEDIGEIRNMVIENEKKMKDIEVKATLSSDLVKEVKPEAFAQQINKTNSGVETLKARIDAMMSLNESIIEELKNIKRQMGLFKGTDAIFKLNDDIKKELINIQKIKATVDGHANKVEQIFIDIQKNFANFTKLENDAESAISISSNLEKEINIIKVKMEALATKEHIAAARKEIRSDFSTENANIVKTIKSISDFVEKLAQNAYKESASFNKKEIDNEKESIKKELYSHRKWLSELLGLMELIQKRLKENEKPGNHKEISSKKMEGFNKSLNALKNAIQINDAGNAKKLYLETVKIYHILEEMEKRGVYEELKGLYNKIQRWKG